MTTPDLTNYRAVHTALRRAPRQLEHAVRTLDPTDRRRIKALAAYWKGYAGEVLAHHTIEDDHFFPALLARVAGTASMIERTDADHHELDELMERCTAAVATLVRSPAADRRPLVDALGALGDHMDEHLDFEDTEILPLFEHHFSAEQYTELDDAAVKSLGIGAQAAFSVPFIVDVFAPEERAQLLKDAPVPMRVLYRLTRGRYARLSNRALGAASTEVDLTYVGEVAA